MREERFAVGLRLGPDLHQGMLNLPNGFFLWNADILGADISIIPIHPLADTVSVCAGILVCAGIIVGTRLSISRGDICTTHTRVAGICGTCVLIIAYKRCTYVLLAAFLFISLFGSSC